MYYNIIVSMVKYWLRLQDTDYTKDRLLFETLNENCKMFQKGQHCWLRCIYLILKDLNLLHWFHLPPTNSKGAIHKLKSTLKSKFENSWKNEISKAKQTDDDTTNGNKLRTYAIFKSQFKPEEYLKLNCNNQRRTLSQFRISAHKLAIERGRYTIPKTPVSNRLCTNCNLGQVEDELHFLLVCPKYQSARDIYINSKISNQQFPNLSLDNKFMWLMSNEDLSICKSVSSYLLHCFDLRSTT